MGVHFSDKSFKISLWVIVIAIILIGMITSFLVVRFIKTINENTEEIEEISELDDLESASIDIGKSVNEVSNQMEEENIDTTENNVNDMVEEESAVSSNITEASSSNEIETNDSESKGESTKEETVQVKFETPVTGEIIRGFASDSLVYSETLEEWVTHNGVDIKADKTTVVKAAASGTVYSIKSDPRYGLTVIVNHENGYQTVYSNLLTAEYVVEGEEIETGQTIGTVGNSATFEIADEYHLHFELLKDGEYLDPTQYIDF